MLQPIQTRYCTTEIGAERPIHRCGHPMNLLYVRNGRQRWQCMRVSCLPPEKVEQIREWRKARNRERYATDPEYRERCLRSNERRFFVGGMYLGMSGFTNREREEILNGSTD